MSYSTSAQDTGRTWVDGKRIYKKVYQTILPNDDGNVVLDLNYANIIKIYGVLNNGGNNFLIPYNYIDGNNNYYGIYIYYDGSRIHIITYTDQHPYFFAGSSLFIVVEYTNR